MELGIKQRLAKGDYIQVVSANIAIRELKSGNSTLKVLWCHRHYCALAYCKDDSPNNQWRNDCDDRESKQTVREVAIA